MICATGLTCRSPPPESRPPLTDTLLSLELTPATVLLCIVVLLIGAALGWLLGSSRLRSANASLSATLEAERAHATERLHILEDSLNDSFAHLSNQALARNNSLFLDLAAQRFRNERATLHADSRSSAQTVAGLVKPLNDALRETRDQINRLEQDRRHAEGALGSRLDGLLEAQRGLHQETRNLVNSLRRPEVRGRWGEMTLRRLVELAGMSAHCDFSEQPTVSTDDGLMRPDMVIHLPANRQVVVDAKTPLDAYLSAVECSDADEREALLKRHCAAVKARIDELSRKRYWQQFDGSLDFVVLFIPGDQFLSVALDADTSLLERALSRRVIPATPGSLVGLLRAIAFGWKQDALSANADAIRQAGEDILERLSIVGAHIDTLGKGLDASVAQYNRLAGSWESRLMPGAKRFEGLGIAPSKAVPSPGQVERRSREIQRIVVPDHDATDAEVQPVTEDNAPKDRSRHDEQVG